MDSLDRQVEFQRYGCGGCSEADAEGWYEDGRDAVDVVTVVDVVEVF